MRLKNIATGIVQGHDFKRMSRKLQDDMHTGYYEARRLIETETTFALERAKDECFKEIGIKHYRYIAEIDGRTSQVCKSLNGQVFDMKDREIGVNCPPMHPFCRSVTVPEISKKRYMSDIEKSSNFNTETQKLLENEFGKLNTNKVILFKERVNHIKDRHHETVNTILNNYNSIIKKPDYILKDSKNENTIWIITKIDNNQMNGVVKLSVREETGHKGFLNSMITSYKTDEKRIEKHIKKHKVLYKKK